MSPNAGHTSYVSSSGMPSEGRGWDLGLSLVEFMLQAFGIVSVGGAFMAELDELAYPELTIALLSFFVMNLETAYDLSCERSEVLGWHSRWLRIIYQLTRSLMGLAVAIGGVLALFSMAQLKNVDANALRTCALCGLGLPTFLHLAYRLVLLIVSEQGEAPTGAVSQIDPVTGPSSSDLEVQGGGSTQTRSQGVR